MTATDVKHGLTEKEYTDEIAHDAAARGHVATDQYVLISIFREDSTTDACLPGMGSRSSNSIRWRNES
jgi:hypothetical protein